MGAKMIQGAVAVLVAAAALTAAAVQIKAYQDGADRRLQALLAQREQAAAKLAATRLPPIEQVGAEAYRRLARENAQQGLALKQLDHAIGQRAAELHIQTPEGDQEQLEAKLIAAQAAFSDGKAEWLRAADSPEKERYLQKIERLMAMLARIEGDYRAHRKAPQALLQEMEALLQVE